MKKKNISIIVLLLLLIISCNKPNEKKSETEIKKIDLKELLSKSGNYWYVYDMDSISNKFILTINCWKFFKDGSLEAGWFFDDSLNRDFNSIAGHKIFPESWNCSTDNKTLYLGENWWKYDINKVIEDTIYCVKNGKEVLLINWGEKHINIVDTLELDRFEKY